jgi:hypothetical protein
MSCVRRLHDRKIQREMRKRCNDTERREDADVNVNVVLTRVAWSV